MVNCGEEKVKVHTNVVPRSTGNTNSGTDNYYSKGALQKLEISIQIIFKAVYQSNTNSLF